MRAWGLRCRNRDCSMELRNPVSRARDSGAVLRRLKRIESDGTRCLGTLKIRDFCLVGELHQADAVLDFCQRWIDLLLLLRSEYWTIIESLEASTMAISLRGFSGCGDWWRTRVGRSRGCFPQSNQRQMCNRAQFMAMTWIGWVKIVSQS